MAKIELDAQRWDIPKTVDVKGNTDTGKAPIQIPIAAVDKAIVKAMVQDWLDDVYKAVGLGDAPKVW